ncbi:MAG: protein RarD [Rhizobiaceae bacterium]|nr:protein RarD [Rhizobiaceae bacterium]
MAANETDTIVTAPVKTVADGDTPKGFVLALVVFMMWGFLPLYLKLVAHLPPLEVLAHRIIWSVPFAGVVVGYAGQGGEIAAACRQPKTLAVVALCSVFICINWGTYIWAVSNAHTVDAALGYFINPLFSIALAAVILREQLSRTQLMAIALAVMAVVIMAVEIGSIPVVALLLPFSFGMYAFLHKIVPIGGNPGFTLEALIMSLPAAGYIIWLEATGNGHFLGSLPDALLLIGCGAATAIPLMIYANAAKLLKLSTIGIMQYIAPSMIFLIAVLVFREPLQPVKLLAFALIWAALAIYTSSLLRARRRPAPASR